VAERSPDAEPRESRAVSWEAFLSTYLPAAVLALGVGIAVPAIPVLAKSFDVGFGLASFVITAFLIGGAVGTVPTGWVIDRFGRRPVMIGGPILTAIMALLTMTAQTFPELLVYRFLDGWAAQMWVLARLARISHGASAGQRGRQVSWMFGMDNVGRLAGPLVGGVLAANFGPRVPFGVYAALALVALIPTIRLAPELPVQRTTAGTERSTLSISEIVLPRLAYFGVVFFAALARGPVFSNTLHLYAAFMYNLDAAGIGVLASTAGAVALPISFLAGWLMDRYGRKSTMVPGFLAVTVTMLLIASTAYLQLPVEWYIGCFLAGIASQSLTGGSIQTVGTDVAPPQARGMFLGLWRLTGQVGVTISPAIFALLAEIAGYGNAFTYIAAAALATAVLLIFVIPETRKLPAPVAAHGQTP
jgi:MFS family permease